MRTNGIMAAIAGKGRHNRPAISSIDRTPLQLDLCLITGRV
jgi:hypothetical protein